MAKGRMLSTKISLSEQVDEISDDTGKLLFTWSIAHLDYNGCIEASPKRLRATVFPMRDLPDEKVKGYIEEWVNLGLVKRYEVGDKEYLFYPTFRQLQQGLRPEREGKSPIPPPEFMDDAFEHLSEQDMEDVIAYNFSECIWGLPHKIVTLQRQFRIGNSYIDIYIEDDAGHKIALEVKKHELTNKALAQVHGYCQEIGEGALGILVGKSVAKNFDNRTAKKQGVSTYTMVNSLITPVKITDPCCQINVNGTVPAQV